MSDNNLLETLLSRMVESQEKTNATLEQLVNKIDWWSSEINSTPSFNNINIEPEKVEKIYRIMYATRQPLRPNPNSFEEKSFVVNPKTKNNNFSSKKEAEEYLVGQKILNPKIIELYV